MCVPEEITVLLLSNLKMYHLFAINIEKLSFLKIMIFCKLEYLFEVFEQYEIFLSYPSLDLSTHFSTGTSQLGAHTRTLVWIISSFCHSLNNDSGMSEWLYKIDAHTDTRTHCSSVFTSVFSKSRFGWSVQSMCLLQSLSQRAFGC